MAKNIKVVIVNPEAIPRAKEVFTKALYDCYVKSQCKKESQKAQENCTSVS
ncbi:hypothetical protein [Clostridium sp.]|uniref:hypothetical protein n=1 Tax=Clostridium sp. TaxID=1506 RepID=UPI002FC8BAC0